MAFIVTNEDVECLRRQLLLQVYQLLRQAINVKTEYIKATCPISLRSPANNCYIEPGLDTRCWDPALKQVLYGIKWSGQNGVNCNLQPHPTHKESTYLSPDGLLTRQTKEFQVLRSRQLTCAHKQPITERLSASIRALPVKGAQYPKFFQLFSRRK